MTFRQTQAREIYQGRLLRLTQDRVDYPDGRQGVFDVLHHPGAVTILALDSEDQVWFVEQYRPGVQEHVLELPAGTLDSGEDPAACAARELQEEVGMKAGTLELLGSGYLAPGYSTEIMYYYFATDLMPSSLPQDAGEDLRAIPFPRNRLMALTREGKLKDAKTLAGILLAVEKLGIAG